MKINISDKRKIFNHITDADENNDIFLVNTVSSAKRNWILSRKINILKIIVGELEMTQNTSKTAIENLIEEINRFKIVVIKHNIPNEDINSFIKKHLLKKKDTFKI